MYMPLFDTDRIVKKLKYFDHFLPDWWFWLKVIPRSDGIIKIGASCGPDVKGRDRVLLKVRRFDRGFFCKSVIKAHGKHEAFIDAILSCIARMTHCGARERNMFLRDPKAYIEDDERRYLEEVGVGGVYCDPSVDVRHLGKRLKLIDKAPRRLKLFGRVPFEHLSEELMTGLLLVPPTHGWLIGTCSLSRDATIFFPNGERYDVDDRASTATMGTSLYKATFSVFGATRRGGVA